MSQGQSAVLGLVGAFIIAAVMFFAAWMMH